MKTKISILAILVILLSSCGAEIAATQEIEVVTEVPVIETPVTEAPVTQEPVVTEEPNATEPATQALTEHPLVCVMLLEPINKVTLPVVGKVTFSWTSMDDARSYVLNFTLPSGAIASFETDQTFRDRYMEAFVSGGEYQWQVIVQGANGNEICVSKVSTFDKPAYKQPQKQNGVGNDGINDDGGDGLPTADPPPTGCPPGGCDD